MKYEQLFLLFAALILLSCNSTIRQKGNIQVEKTDSIISLAIPSGVTPTTRNIRYFVDDGKQYIAILNSNTSAIDVICLTKGCFVKSIKPQIEGPNGLGSKMDGFDMVCFDTIIVSVGGMHNKLFIIDSSAAIRNQVEFNIYNQPYLPVCTLWSSYGYVSNYDGENVYLSNVCRARREEFEMLHDYSIGFCYNIKTGKQLRYPINHPNVAMGKDKILYSEQSFLKIGNKVVLSYMLGHQVFVSIDNGPWQVYDIKSSFVKKRFSRPKASNIVDVMKEYDEAPAYLVLVYDKYRQVYYRFVYPGITVEPGDDVMKLGEFRRIFSVMVMDEDFNILGETLMPENTYNSNMFFINEAGLWISTNHPDNPDFDEDVIKFQLFTLK